MCLAGWEGPGSVVFPGPENNFLCVHDSADE